MVVYNACGAVLSIAQGFPDVQTVLQGDGSTRILRDAMERHGGIEEMYGTEVARLADWVAVNAKPKRDKPHLPGKTEYVTEKLYHEEYGLVPITPANERQIRGGPRYQSPNGTIRCGREGGGAGRGREKVCSCGHGDDERSFSSHLITCLRYVSPSCSGSAAMPGKGEYQY